tara:strand:- start:1404 stop:2798 length:1395 start_codon:yes stop_codon:yes gene_type:complete
MITIFPTDAYANDFSGHIAKLHLLDKYGLYENVPEWYNGNYTMLKFYPPVWYLFALPFLWLFKDIELAAFMSMIVMYLVGFVFIFVLGKLQKLSTIKKLALYLFFFANPISIGYFMRLGKMPEMLAWVIFIPYFTLFYSYLKKKVDLIFLVLFIFFYSLIFYIHTLVFVVASLLALAFFLTRKTWKERIYLALSVGVVVVITSFFWYPFIVEIGQSVTADFAALQWLIQPGNIADKIASFVLPILFLLVGWVYLKKYPGQKRFFLVPIIFSLLILTRLAVFIPFFNRASPDTYHLFYIFLTAFMFVSLTIKDLPKKIRTLYPVVLIVGIVLAILISAMFTPFFKPHTPIVEETFELFGIAEGPLLVIKGTSEVHPASVLSYATIYHNMSTPAGWEPINITAQFWENVLLPERLIIEQDVNNMSQALKGAYSNSVIVYDEYCQILKQSDLVEVQTLKRSCLYTLP